MFKIQTLIKSIVRNLYLKTLLQALNSTSLIKAKPLEICLPCLLMQKVATSFYGIDSLYSILKVIMKLFGINQKEAAFQDNKS